MFRAAGAARARLRGALGARRARERQVAGRGARRGAARDRRRRVRRRDADADARRRARAGQPRRRHRALPPSHRRGGGDHAVQLPGDGAAVDGADRGRGRQRLHPQALAADAALRDAARRAVRGGGRAGGCLQRRPRRGGGGERDLRPRADPRRLLRRLRSGREARSTPARPRRASASRRSPARRTTSWSCRTPTSTSPSRACSPPPSPMRGSAASPERSASRSAQSATSCPSASPGWPGRRGSARGSTPRARSRPSRRSAARERIAGYIELGEQEGARILVDGRREDGDGFFLGPTILDRVRPEMRVAQEEIFGPVLALERLDSLDEALDGDRAATSSATRARSSPAAARSHVPFGARSRPEWSESTSPCRPRWRFSPSPAGRARSTAISMRRAWTACVSSPRPRSSRAAGNAA